MFELIASSIPGHNHRASHKHRCMNPSPLCLPLVHHAVYALTFLWDLCLKVKNRDDITLSQKKYTALPWGCGHVHPCCCLRFRKPATAFRCASPPVLSHDHKSLLIDCEDDELLSNDLLLSSSALLFWRSSSNSDDAWSPVREVVQVSRSPCRRGSSRSSPSAWQSPHSPSLPRVAHGRSCGPLRPISESRRDLRAFNIFRVPMISPLSSA